MTNDNCVGLVATLHDPEGRMVPYLASSLPILRELYGFLLVIATPNSDPRTISALRNGGIDVILEGTDEIGTNRRQVVALGLRKGATPFLQYCDFDRLLYWTWYYPQELAQLVSGAVPGADYLAIGRTAEAFASHPPVQQELEALTNRVFSYVFGHEMDVTAGSCGLSRAAAEHILRHSQEKSNATDTEWPMIIACLAPPELTVDYIAVQGLAFETTTFYGPGAYAAADHAANWARRTRLARDSIEAVMRISRK